MKKLTQVLSLFILSSVLLSACNFPKSTPVINDDPLKTAAALTVAALTTQIAATDTFNQMLTPSPSPTVEIIYPTTTPQPSNTLLPTLTSTPEGICDQAAFIDETIEDDSDFLPNSKFNKTWTIRNSGTCTWNTNYAVVFSSGNNAMNAPASQPLTAGTVAPGETIIVSMNMTAPSLTGNYKAEFKLRNADGIIFGFGKDNRPFWAQIDVVNTYNFATNLCAATWLSGTGVLPCPGKDGAANGFVYMDNAPKFETGYQDNEPAIWMGPQNIDNGYIKGIFPPIYITNGMFFQTIIGCHPDAAACNMQMRLNYQADGGLEQPLAVWNEKNDGVVNTIKIDLNSLAGMNVQFILYVEAIGSPIGDKAHWFMPIVGP